MSATMRLGTTPPLKTGRGRQTGAPKRIRDVETQPCPERSGPHLLTNDHNGNTYCQGCGVSWSVLDQEVRAL